MVDSYHLTIDLPQSVKAILPDAEQEVKRFLALKLKILRVFLSLQQIWPIISTRPLIGDSYR
jgi:hypothetical protein